MTKDRRFRGISMARVESVQYLDDGSITVLGFSASGDAVVLTVRPEAIWELVEGLDHPLPPADPPTVHQRQMQEVSV